MILEPSPNGWIFDKTLKPSAHGNERTINNTKFTAHDFLRLHPVISIPQEMMFSKTAKTVENAANPRKRKNNPPHNLPRGR